MKSDLVESQINTKPCSLISKEKEIKKYNMSLNSLILTQVENNILKHQNYADSYRHIYFCGGVLNSKNFSKMIENNFAGLVTGSCKQEITLNFSSDNLNDNIYSFYKGANYLSKLDNIEPMMINRQEYFENGKDRLCFNFI